MEQDIYATKTFGYGQSAGSALAQNVAREMTIQDNLSGCLGEMHDLLNNLRQAKSSLFPPQPEPVTTGSKIQEGPPTVAAMAGNLRSLISEANMLAGSIAARI